MDQEDCLRLRYNYKLLVNTITLDEVQDALVNEGILEQDLLARIGEGPSEEDKMRRLLRELPRGGPAAYKVFCDAIKDKDCYNHVLEALDATNVGAPLATAEQINVASENLPDECLRLEANYKLLVDNVRYLDVRDQLYQDGVLDDEDVERIDLMTTKTGKERTRTLLKLLTEKSGCYSSFRLALESYPSYKHVTDQLDKTDLESARRKFLGMRKTSSECNQVSDHQGDSSDSWASSLQKAFTTMSQDRACIQNWKQLRVLPGLNESDVYCVETSYSREGPRECVYQLLLCWHQKRGRLASLEELLQGLEDASLRSTAVKLKKIYQS